MDLVASSILTSYIFCLTLIGVYGEAEVLVLFERYSNSGARLENGFLCDSGSLCSPLFQVCIGITASDKCESDVIRFGPYRQQSSITFNDNEKLNNYPEVYNPIRFDVTKWTENARFLVTIYQSTSTAVIGRIDNLFDAGVNKLQPGKSEIQSTYYRKVFKDSTNVISINVRFKVWCSPHFYGSQCSYFCLESDDDIHGHYECDDYGDLVCKPGWLNPAKNCTVRVTTPMPKTTSLPTTTTVETTTVAIETTTIPIETTTVAIETTTILKETTVAPIETTTVPIETPTVPIEITTVPIETPTVPIEITTVPIEITTIPIETTTVPIETTAIPIETTAIPIETTTEPIETTTKLIESTTISIISTTPYTDVHTLSTDTSSLQSTSMRPSTKDTKLYTTKEHFTSPKPSTKPPFIPDWPLLVEGYMTTNQANLLKEAIKKIFQKAFKGRFIEIHMESKMALGFDDLQITVVEIKARINGVDLKHADVMKVIFSAGVDWLNKNLPTKVYFGKWKPISSKLITIHMDSNILYISVGGIAALIIGILLAVFILKSYRRRQRIAHARVISRHGGIQLTPNYTGYGVQHKGDSSVEFSNPVYGRTMSNSGYTIDLTDGNSYA